MIKQKAFVLFSPAFPHHENETHWIPWIQIIVKTINKNYPDLKVVIISFQYPLLELPYVWNGNNVFPFNGMHRGKVSRIIMWLKIFIRFWKIHKQFKVIGVFSLWCNENTFFAKYFGKLFKLKYFSWILGGDAKAQNQWVKRIRPNGNELIALSDFIANEFYKNHKIKPYKVIPPCIDTSMFDAFYSSKDIDVIGVGSFSFLKQFHLFVEIIAEIKKDIPSIKAELCGDGEDKQRIVDLVSKYSLAETLLLPGTIEHQQIINKMQRAKILLHTSNYEGFGVVFLEALYAGAHVISFVKPLNIEIKNWHIVKNEYEMKQKVVELLNNPNIYYEPQLLYSAEEITNTILQLFNYSE